MTIIIIITTLSTVEHKTPRYFPCIFYPGLSSIWGWSQMPRAEEGKPFVSNKETAKLEHRNLQKAVPPEGNHLPSLTPLATCIAFL